jgi:zinc protease
MRLRRIQPATLLVPPLVPLLAGFILLLTSACVLPAKGVRQAGFAGGTEILDARGTFMLENGMEALVVETPSPLVASLILVKTGSRDETVANMGVSHLLEHVLFDGTTRRTMEELFREVYGMGGYLNGFTTEEYTGYILMAHPDFLERMLDIQADILFHSLFDAAKLEVTKGVVIEEIRQALTSPTSREADAHKARLYHGTSYAHPVLGSEQVIRRLSRDQILEYYRARYVPNNMLAVLIGPVDQQSARIKVSQAFGAQPARPLASRTGATPAPPPQAEVFVEETPATRKRIALSLVVPATERDRYPAWEVLAGLLDERLQQAKDRPNAPRILKIGVGFSLAREFALLEVTAAFPRETDETAARRLVDEELARLAAGPVEAGDVRRIQKGLLGEEVRLGERLHYYAMEKAARILALGAEGIRAYGDRIGRVSPDQVGAVARSLAGARYVASVFLPADSGGTAKTAAASLPARRTVLANGLTLIAQQSPDSPIFAAHALIRGRGGVEGEGQEGSAEALLRLLGRGTARRTAVDLAHVLQEMGGRLETAGDPTTPFGDFYTSREYGYIRLEALAEHSRPALALLAEILTEPRLAPEEVEKVRADLRAFAEAGEQQPRRVAEGLLYRTLFPGHPLGKPIYGTASSIGSLGRDQLLLLRERYLGSRNLTVSIVSGLPADAAIAAAREALSQIPPGSAAPAAPPLPVTRGIREVREHLGKPQAQLLFGKALPPVGERERFALEIAGSILSARLFGTLREKEGLAYSIDAGVSFPQGGTLLVIGMGTAPQNVEQARVGILRELKTVAETLPTKEEIERRANGLAGRLAMRMLPSINRAYYLGVAEFRDLPLGHWETYRQSLLSVTPEEVAEAFRKYFGQDAYVLAIVD